MEQEPAVRFPFFSRRRLPFVFLALSHFRSSWLSESVEQTKFQYFAYYRFKLSDFVCILYINTD